jgi:hypothetical protein
MAYMAAISVADRFKLVDFPLPTMEAAMVNAFATSPTPDAVTVVAKDQRASTAPRQEDLFRLVKGRLAPIRIDSQWFKGSIGLVYKAFTNVLENPNANVIHWDKAQYNIWMTEAEAARQAKEKAEARAKCSSQHGFVYAFRYRHKNVEWMKVGMTDSDDEAACWGRIKDYVKQHDLPRDGWSFVGFIASTQAHALEQRLHRRLRKYKITKGSMRELFRCSVVMYEAILDAEYEFITAHEPDTVDAEIERAKQEEARRQAAKAKAEAEAKARVDRETREKAEREKARETAEREAWEREKPGRHEHWPLERRISEWAKVQQKRREDKSGTKKFDFYVNVFDRMDVSVAAWNMPEEISDLAAVTAAMVHYRWMKGEGYILPPIDEVTFRVIQLKGYLADNRMTLEGKSNDEAEAWKKAKKLKPGENIPWDAHPPYYAPERIERVARERREQAGRERAIREQHEKEMRELIEQIKREKAERKARRKQWWLAMRKLISKEGLLIVVDIVPMTLFLASIVVLLIVIYSTI